MKNSIVFDIETGPLPEMELMKLAPEFVPPKNYRKPEAIEAYIAEAKLEWKDNAALSALTGRVLAIGILDETGTTVAGVDDESDLLTWFWDKVRNNPVDFVGFSIKQFDLPFLCQRSWIKGVFIPGQVFNGRYFSGQFVDLQERWMCFGRDHKGQSLDAICKSCGIGGKTGNGKDFAKLWGTNRDAAIEYCKTDLRLTAALAERLV